MLKQPLTSCHLKRKVVFQPSIFTGYVSVGECSFSLLRGWVSEVHEEKAYGSDNDYDGGESDDEGPEKLGRKEMSGKSFQKMKLKYPKAKTIQ